MVPERLPVSAAGSAPGRRFVTFAAGTILWDVPGWWVTALGSVFLAALVVAVEMRKPSYHGVGWRRINPNLFVLQPE